MHRGSARTLNVLFQLIKPPRDGIRPFLIVQRASCQQHKPLHLPIDAFKQQRHPAIVRTQVQIHEYAAHGSNAKERASFRITGRAIERSARKCETSTEIMAME